MASATATAAGCVRWRCTRRRDALGSHVPLRDPVSALRITTKTNVKRGTWDSPDVENEKPGGDSSDESHSEVALNLDDEEVSDTNDPPEMSPFEPDRDDGMPKMPVPKIEIQNPGGWSPIAYAFLGDAVFELYVRRLFFNPPQRPNDYDLKCKRAVRAEAQDKLLRLLIDRGEFTGTLWVFREQHAEGQDSMHSYNMLLFAASLSQIQLTSSLLYYPKPPPPQTPS